MKSFFANKENECVQTRDGLTIWLSRSCATVAQVCLYNLTDKRWYILLGKRGPHTPDYQGFWCLPCGYLDWNETLYKGMLREVWEECGLFLPHLSQQQGFVNFTNKGRQGSGSFGFVILFFLFFCVL